MIKKIKQRYRLEENGLTGLVETKEFFDSQSSYEQAITGYSQLLDNFLFADFLMESSVKYDNKRNIAFAYQLYRACLLHLILLSKKYSKISNDVRDYLPRLEEFSERNSQLQPVYEAYEKAFGVTGGEA